MEGVAVVTGVASGIGRATADKLSSVGLDVVGVDVEEPASDTQMSGFLKLDLGDADAVREYLPGVAGSSVPVRVLANVAGIQRNASIATLEVEDWDRVLAVNVRSMFLTIRTLLPRLQEQGAAVVNVSSVHAIATTAGASAYVASKGAVLAFTRAAAIELAPRVRVNAVLPGAVETAMLKKGVQRFLEAGQSTEEGIRHLGARCPMGRVGRPEDLAEAIAFLADDERSGYITGQGLVVDGGVTAAIGNVGNSAGRDWADRDTAADGQG